MGKSDLTYTDFWSDMVAAYTVKKPPPGAITAYEFASRTELSMSRARDILNDKVRKGVLQKEKFQAVEEGRGRPYYYWPVDSTEE